MTDLTVALTFILAVHSLTSVAASSKTLEVVRRQTRQHRIAEAFADALRIQNRGATIRFNKLYGNWQILVGERIMGDVWLNGNFLRVSTYEPIWRSGESRVRDQTAFGRVYGGLAPIIKANAGNLSYLYVHGIVEPRERAGSSAMALSRERADVVFEHLQEQRVVGPFTTSAAYKDPNGGFWVPAKYCVTWGTGSNLYASGSMPVGRVDLVLFFRDDETFPTD